MIRVIAKFSVKADGIDPFMNIAKELVTKTVEEEGCISYEMVQDTKNSTQLFMLEEWKSKEALDQHLTSAHFTLLVPQMVKYAESKPEMTICHKVF